MPYKLFNDSVTWFTKMSWLRHKSTQGPRVYKIQVQIQFSHLFGGAEQKNLKIMKPFEGPEYVVIMILRL